MNAHTPYMRNWIDRSRAECDALFDALSAYRKQLYEGRVPDAYSTVALSDAASSLFGSDECLDWAEDARDQVAAEERAEAWHHRREDRMNREPVL